MSTLWTTLTIPISCTIEDEDTVEGEKWITIINPMNQRIHEKFLYGVWGRVTEDPETVWFITAWESAEAASDFEKSTAGILQHERLALLSITPLTTVHIDFSNYWWGRLSAHTGIMDVHFPSLLSQDSRNNIAAFRGLRPRYSRGPRAPVPTNGRGIRGFVKEDVGFEGEKTVVLRCFDYWSDGETELAFKADERYPAGEGVWKSFLEDCKKEGMIGVPVERHFDYEDFVLSSKMVSEEIWEKK